MGSEISSADFKHAENAVATSPEEYKVRVDLAAMFRLTAMFGKKFYGWTLKGGMMESRGGLGVEYNFYRNRFRASFDAFDFETPNVRAYLRYSFFKGLYVVGGQQYIFENGNDNASSFIGAGLFLTNDDIKVLLSRINF